MQEAGVHPVTTLDKTNLFGYTPRPVTGGRGASASPMSPTTRGWCVSLAGRATPRTKLPCSDPRDEGIVRVYLGWACHLARPAHVQTFASGPNRRCESVNQPPAVRTKWHATLPRARHQGGAHQPHRHSIMGNVRPESVFPLSVSPEEAPRLQAELRLEAAGARCPLPLCSHAPSARAVCRIRRGRFLHGQRHRDRRSVGR